MTNSAPIFGLGMSLILALSSCSSSGDGEPLTAVEAARILEALPGLCPEANVSVQSTGEPRAFSEGRAEISQPGFSQIDCGIETGPMSLFIFASGQEKSQAQQFACLNFAASNPELVNGELTGKDWEVIWLTGNNWEGFVFDYPPDEVASALGGQASPRRDICIPYVQEMVLVAANPLAPEPDLSRALEYLTAVGYPQSEREGLVKVLNLFCKFLSTMDEESVIGAFAEGQAGALFTEKQAKQFIEALKFGNYDCTKHKVEDD